MAEPTRFVFKHKEVAEALIKKQGLHEGIWGVYVRFGLAASNVGASTDDLNPAAIVPVVEIGIQTFEQENNLSVDAAVVNPKLGKATKAKKR